MRRHSPCFFFFPERGKNREIFFLPEERGGNKKRCQVGFLFRRRRFRCGPLQAAEQKRASVAGQLFSFEKREGEPETDDETGEEKKILVRFKSQLTHLPEDAQAL